MSGVELLEGTLERVNNQLWFDLHFASRSWFYMSSLRKSGEDVRGARVRGRAMVLVS
jgi:hypothetical protein